MFLLDKTNQDWWNIRKNSGETGYVPANYVKEIEPKLVSVEVKKPIAVKDVKKVKKTQYVKQKVTPVNQKSGMRRMIYSNGAKFCKCQDSFCKQFVAPACWLVVGVLYN